MSFHSVFWSERKQQTNTFKWFIGSDGMKNKLTKSSKTEGLFFLDSGAHSLYTKEVIKKKHVGGYAFFESDAFWVYVDSYAEFVRKHERYIDYYANVDVIFNPELSWKVLKYLEKEHGLHPLPVVHYGTSLKWIEKHLEAGYEFIGLGGLGQEATAKAYKRWADQVFTRLCPPPDYTPIVRTHGFAMTAYGLLLRYPWFSVDSATWTKVGAFGSIMVPHKRAGKFVFSEKPYNISVSEDSPDRKVLGKHITTMSKGERQIVMEWLETINIPYGTNDENGEPVEFGVCNRHSERKVANLLFFEKLRESLPLYPRSFKPVAKQGFELC